MKLLCSVSIGNRLLPSLAINSNRRHVNSTLVLCKNYNSVGFSILLFSAQNQNGFKYQVQHIFKVLNRFVNEGKATIQFRIPEHDLYIQADSTLLKIFLDMLKLALENKLPDKKVMTISSSAVRTKPVAKKLCITKPSDYPTKGFPRTLEHLSINNIDCSSVDRGILQLTKLQVLNIGYNCLDALPMELSNLSLTELIVEHNKLFMATLKQWNWLSGNLSKSLLVLNLRNNCISYIPNHLLNKFQQLQVLLLDNNKLKFLPRGIGRLKNLRILTASNNSLSVLPASCRRMHLEKLNLADNNWDSNCMYHALALANTPPFLSLKEIAARRVLSLQVEFSAETLPFTLVLELENAHYCNCGSPCLKNFIKQLKFFNVQTIAATCSVSPGHASFMPINAYFCSMECYQRDNGMWRRRNIIRFPVANPGKEANEE